ncbi:hypothetical protein M422DRAFT_274647, partial [Sphaerobolus stellatus SS14]
MSSKPLAGSRRPKRTHQKKKALDYAIKLPDNVDLSRQVRDSPHLPQASRKGTMVAMPFNQTYFQSRNLPLQSSIGGMGRLAKRLKTDHPQRPPSPANSPGPMTGGEDDGWGLDLAAIKEYQASQDVLRKKERREHYKARYRRKKQSQHRRWLEDIVPSLVPLYQRWLHETDTGRVELSSSPWLEVETRPCTCAQTPHKHSLVVGYWNRLENLDLTICQCKPASEQLMIRGLLGCAPMRPSIAFDINLLDL